MDEGRDEANSPGMDEVRDAIVGGDLGLALAIAGSALREPEVGVGEESTLGVFATLVAVAEDPGERPEQGAIAGVLVDHGWPVDASFWRSLSVAMGLVDLASAAATGGLGSIARSLGIAALERLESAGPAVARGRAASPGGDPRLDAMAITASAELLAELFRSAGGASALEAESRAALLRGRIAAEALGDDPSQVIPAELAVADCLVRSDRIDEAVAHYRATVDDFASLVDDLAALPGPPDEGARDLLEGVALAWRGYREHGPEADRPLAGRRLAAIHALLDRAAPGAEPYWPPSG